MINHLFDKSIIIEGRVWLIYKDNIDTRLIYPQQFHDADDFNEMGQFTFKEFEGYENFAQQALPGDIIITGKNFGCGTFYPHTIDCFISLGIQAVIAKSFCESYENKAIHAGFPVITYDTLDDIRLEQGDRIRVNFVKGMIINLRNNRLTMVNSFSEKQMNIYLKGGVF
ncbi:MAG TPA: hypothetical protein VJ896_12530 [Bacteroidales bacterium]|nr:hypothetical protein [Bacteroidales bacterium]